ncbi:anti-sigma factor [Methylocystis sp. SC2]|uniref:anti-sigma factor family protein n=1 Tax=Methylocystis sp. (strain SC2) TaxID=187303 RepID=UPI00027AE92F|nr:anti-sigma factor [Methylocystis sp. SC2]CCJ06765.1 Putative transmembrane anti-sigma factor [Methylocystis sp. SC2]
MTPSALIEEADLHALVDGELDPERRRKVEDHLLQHPEDAALVEGWRRQNAALRAAFEPVALETPPLSLREAAARPPAPPAGQGPIETGAIHWGRPGAAPRPTRKLDEIRASRRRQALASTLLTLIAGAAVAAATLLFLASRPPAQSPMTRAIAATSYAARAGLTYATYILDPRPVEVEASRRGELLAWLQERVGFSRAPDLSGVGLRLLGGRVAPGVAAPAAFLVYERDDGGRVGLYFERAEALAAPAGQRGQGVSVIEWRAGGFAFVLVGALAPEAMQAAAEAAAAAVAATPAQVK